MPRGVKRFGSRSSSSRHCFVEAELVGRVVDREVRAVAEVLRLAAEDAAAGGVEGHHPGGARGRADEALDALAHLRGGLVREGDREDLGRLRARRGEQVRDAARQHARLARSLRRRSRAPAPRSSARPRAAPDSGLRGTSRGSWRPPFDRSGGSRRAPPALCALGKGAAPGTNRDPLEAGAASPPPLSWRFAPGRDR